MLVRMPVQHARVALLVFLLAVPALAIAAPPRPAEVPDTLEQRLLACAQCHGAKGEGVQKNEAYPRLAGKPAGYLYNQLLNFRERRRRYAVMNYMVAYLSDAYLREIAEYYSQLHPPYPPRATAAAPAVLARGKQLVEHGDPARKLPACRECHGERLTGRAPAIPGLVGLSPLYISQEMGAWRSGHRHAKAPDCMEKVASALSAEDSAAVAAFLAMQPAEAGAPPRLDDPSKLPLECGSVLQK
jgi:cytochrome c553